MSDKNHNKQMTESLHNIEQFILQKMVLPEEFQNPVLILLLDGVFDEDCSLSVFRHIPHVLQRIWTFVTDWWDDGILRRETLWEEDELSFYELDTTITFPEPKDICINMMPFYMENSFEKTKLPDYLKPYWDNIINNKYEFGFPRPYSLIPDQECGKIGFLTIHESYVNADESQRRPGIHTDSPGKLMIVPDEFNNYFSLGKVSDGYEGKLLNNLNRIGYEFIKGKAVNFPQVWGFHRGIYMASNVSDSCKVWDCKIALSENGREDIIGPLGDLEHLRGFLPDHEIMEKNKVYWISDRTPHESLPLKEGSYRQYFRLVTSEVSVWFEDHSTKNPNGVVPDPAITKVVKGSKFKNWSSLIELEHNSVDVKD